MVAVGLAVGSSAAAQDGRPASNFRPRSDAPASLILPVQAKTAPESKPGTPPMTTPPGTVPPGTPPGTVPGGPQGKGPATPGIPGLPPPGKDPMLPGKGATPGATDPLPGGPGVGPSKGPATGTSGDTGSGLAAPTTRAGQDPYEAYIRLEPPGRERLFGSRDTERELEERMRQERRDGTTPGDPIQFPPKPELTDKPYEPRRFAPMVELAEPAYVVHRRLYFEEKNSERYGWDLGIAQPAVSTLAFFRDTLLFPHNFASYPCRRFDTSAGKCRPGDPVPYILYPPEFTATGLLAEVGAVGLLFYAIP